MLPLAAPPSPATPHRRQLSHYAAVRAVRRAGAGGQAGLRADECRTPRPWRRSAGGWMACRWRSSWPPRGSAPLARGACWPRLGAPPAAADGRRARSAGAAADAARRDRLELRPADADRAAAVPAAGVSSSAAAPWRRPRRSAIRAASWRRRAATASARWSTRACCSTAPTDGEPRFTMLETIREYGLEQLERAASRGGAAGPRGLLPCVGGGGRVQD